MSSTSKDKGGNVAKKVRQAGEVSSSSPPPNAPEWAIATEWRHTVQSPQGFRTSMCEVFIFYLFSQLKQMLINDFQNISYGNNSFCALYDNNIIIGHNGYSLKYYTEV